MKIAIASPIHDGAVKRLREAHKVVKTFNAGNTVLESETKDADVIVLRSGVTLDKQLLDNSTNLKLIIRAGSGIDNIDLMSVKQRGIRLYRIPQPGARAVAEMSFAMMLSLSRNLQEAHNLTKDGNWKKHDFEGHHLHKKTLGIIGAGNIGTTVGELGVAWGMKVYGCVEKPDDKTKTRLSKLGMELTDINKVLKLSDYISIHVPLQDSTISLIDEKELSIMKPSAILINLARGGVVNENALAKALRAGTIKAAALDVHENEGEGQISPLASLPNVILTPHIGAQTVDAQKEVGKRIIEIINKHMKTNTNKELDGSQKLISTI